VNAIWLARFLVYWTAQRWALVSRFDVRSGRIASTTNQLHELPEFGTKLTIRLGGRHGTISPLWRAFFATRAISFAIYHSGTSRLLVKRGRRVRFPVHDLKSVNVSCELKSGHSSDCDAGRSEVSRWPSKRPRASVRLPKRRSNMFHQLNSLCREAKKAPIGPT